MRDIRVATVQFQHAAGDKAYNFGRLRHFVTEAARARVEMIAFPEMCLTGYWHVRKLSRAAFEALAEPVPDGPSTRDLLALSREYGMTIGAATLALPSLNPNLRSEMSMQGSFHRQSDCSRGTASISAGHLLWRRR